MRSLVLLVGLLAPAAPSPSAPEGIEPLAADLAALRTDPVWLGERVRFRVQLAGVVETWNPWVTRFGPADWVGFEAWPDERFTFDEAVYRDPAPRLFVRRGSAAARALAAAARYARFEVVGAVRERLLDEPWIEVESVEELEGFVGEGTILHVVRAQELQAQGAFDLALEQLERALAGPLPPHAAQEVQRRIAACRAAGERAKRGVKILR